MRILNTACGHSTVIDDQWYELLKGKPIRLDRCYFRVTINGVERRLHRVVMGIQKDDAVQIDHINGDPSCNLISNPRKVSPKENSRNRTSNRILHAFGRSLCLAQWMDEPECAPRLTYECLRWRVRNGWSGERALSTPPKNGPAVNPV